MKVTNVNKFYGHKKVTLSGVSIADDNAAILALALSHAGETPGSHFGTSVNHLGDGVTTVTINTD